MLLLILCPSPLSHTSFGGSSETPLIPLLSINGGRGSSSAGVVPHNYTIDSKSVVGVKPGDSSVVIGYQVDNFT